MADEYGISQTFNLAGMSEGFGVLGEILVYGLIVLLVLTLVYLIYYLMTFNNKLIVRDGSKKNKIIKVLRWKRWKDKNGNIWLITPFKKVKKPLPPFEAIDIAKKGRLWVEAWRGEDSDTLIYIEDNFDYTKYKEENVSFQPLTTQERELLVNEVAKSENYKQVGAWDRILQILPYMVPVIMVLIILMGVGDFTEAVNGIGKPLYNAVEIFGDKMVTASENFAGVQRAPDNIPEAPN